jgi:uncharacterized protein with ParB-like and HNH nuclease domain
MDTAKYSIREILEFKNLEQFIVPEIQRDYVWKVKDIDDFLSSLEEGFKEVNKDIPYLGFIYAYNDRDYVYKYILVDGQQRMTTIFLLLLACYSKLGKKLPEYLLKKGKLKLDYKVRAATHDFLFDLVNFCNNNPDQPDFIIKDQIWFHSGYEIDRTIISMVENFNAIRDRIHNFDSSSLSNFIKFIENQVKLSYFDIENGRQGEELYIYMNSRGRQLASNETLKAKFLKNLDTISEKEKWGRTWEHWQDFFWKHRGKRSDADAGFNDFLHMVQIINMCDLGKSSDEINLITRSKSEEVLNFELLPDSLEDLLNYFQAFEYLVNNYRITEFFKQYENINDFFTSSSIDPRRKQIYFLRTLPILAFLSNTGIIDDKSIFRFIRYFYNISRKELSVGKDIANQLPIAIKLMLEYGRKDQESFDVCDLITYQKGRTVLINDEEVLKLRIYKSPPMQLSREDMEDLFWKAEDHFVFDGEIFFLLNRYYDFEKQELDVINYKNSWTIFEQVFTDSKINYAQITRALLYYGNTWFRDTPWYYINYSCQDWYSLVRDNSGKHLITLLEDLHNKPLTFLDKVIKSKAKKYFKDNHLISIENIKSQEGLLEQVKILVALDYFTDKVIWKDHGYIACDERYTCKTYRDIPFFNNGRVIHNVSRYINDGCQGRIIPSMKEILQNANKLQITLEEIIR